MAGLPGRSSERALTRSFLRGGVLAAVAAATLGSGPAAARAQQAPPPRPTAPPPGAATVELRLRLGSVVDVRGGEIGGAATVTVAAGIALGGGGAILSGRRELAGDPLFPEREVDFGYGGLVVELPGPPLVPGARTRIRTLLGAGHAEVRDRVSRTRLGADNVVVVEPELLLVRPLTPWLAGGAGLSWREVRGVDDLEGIDSGDLGGPGLSLRLRFGPF